MIGHLPVPILVTGIFPLVGIMGMVDGLSMMFDEKGTSNTAVRKTSDGSGNQKFLTCRYDLAADPAVGDSSKGYREELIRSQGIIGLCLPGRRSGTGMETVGQIILFF
jgi:hypothetical protein